MNTCVRSVLHHHGLCLDKKLVESFDQKIDYSATESATAEKAPQPSAETLERVQQILSSLLTVRRNSDEYVALINELCDSIAKNCVSDSPKSVRELLGLGASKPFADWAEQTALTTLAYCNTDKILNI